MLDLPETCLYYGLFWCSNRRKVVYIWVYYKSKLKNIYPSTIEPLEGYLISWNQFHGTHLQNYSSKKERNIETGRIQRTERFFAIRICHVTKCVKTYSRKNANKMNMEELKENNNFFSNIFYFNYDILNIQLFSQKNSFIWFLWISMDLGCISSCGGPSDSFCSLIFARFWSKFRNFLLDALRPEIRIWNSSWSVHNCSFFFRMNNLLKWWSIYTSFTWHVFFNMTYDIHISIYWYGG